MENSGVHCIQQTLSFMPTNVFCASGVCENRILQSEVQEQWSHLEVEEEPFLPVSLVYHLQISSWKCYVQKSPRVSENPSNTMVMREISINQGQSLPEIAFKQFHWEPKAYKYTNQSCNWTAFSRRNSKTQQRVPSGQGKGDLSVPRSRIHLSRFQEARELLSPC